MSKTKTVYVLTNSVFCKLQKNSEAKCTRCHVFFEENNVVATTASNHRYCYNCASQINLVSGNLNLDLNLDVSLRESINHIKKLSKKIDLRKSTEELSIKIITEYFAQFSVHSKNIIGIVCTAIYLSTKNLQNEILDDITEKLPVSFRVIQRNCGILNHLIINSKLLEGFDGN